MPATSIFYSVGEATVAARQQNAFFQVHLYVECLCGRFMVSHLSCQVQHVCVGIIEGKQQPWEAVYVLLHYGHGQVLLGKPAHTQGIQHTPTLGSHLRGTRRWRLTWSQRAISRVFQRETPVVSSRFMLPRNTTRFTRWFLQLACWWRQRWGESSCTWPRLCDQCFICVILEVVIFAQAPSVLEIWDLMCSFR